MLIVLAFPLDEDAPDYKFHANGNQVLCVLAKEWPYGMLYDFHGEKWMKCTLSLNAHQHYYT